MLGDRGFLRVHGIPASAPPPRSWLGQVMTSSPPDGCAAVGSGAPAGDVPGNGVDDPPKLTHGPSKPPPDVQFQQLPCHSKHGTSDSSGPCFWSEVPSSVRVLETRAICHPLGRPRILTTADVWMICARSPLKCAELCFCLFLEVEHCIV